MTTCLITFEMKLRIGLKTRHFLTDSVLTLIMFQ